MAAPLMQMAGCRSRIIRRFLSPSELPREGGECVSAAKDGDDLVDHLKVTQVGDIGDVAGWRVAGGGPRTVTAFTSALAYSPSSSNQ
jgi:hypothetical protein